MNEEEIYFQIPGLTEAEENVATEFVERMHEIAREEGHALDVFRDGGPILVRLVKERLPDYTIDQTVPFVMKVMEAICGTLELSKKKPEGSA